MKKTKDFYGKLPADLGVIDIACSEMMFYQYMPISMKNQFSYKLDERLEVFIPIIEACKNDMGLDKWVSSYIYITAKNVFVNGINSGNRPGWHSDGFLTDDINYIWSDNNPTLFAQAKFDLMPDHEISLIQMHNQVVSKFAIFKDYPVKSLLKLDQYVIHRAPENCIPGYRTFFKLSVSKDQYNLIGNSHNQFIAYNWKMQPREEVRNHPVKQDNTDSVKA